MHYTRLMLLLEPMALTLFLSTCCSYIVDVAQGCLGAHVRSWVIKRRAGRRIFEDVGDRILCPLPNLGSVI